MSGRDELLDKAIVEAKEAEDWQLVEWLRRARGADAAARWCTEKLRDANRTIRKLLNENAKLRELVRYMWRTFMGGKTTAAQRAELRERMRELGVDA